MKNNGHNLRASKSFNNHNDREFGSSGNSRSMNKSYNRKINSEYGGQNSFKKQGKGNATNITNIKISNK